VVVEIRSRQRGHEIREEDPDVILARVRVTIANDPALRALIPDTLDGELDEVIQLRTKENEVFKLIQHTRQKVATIITATRSSYSFFRISSET
jgi:predicted DNA-binding protein (UPF0251 family)